MRKLVLLTLLLSTPAYAADQGDVQKLAQYGQCVLNYGGPVLRAHRLSDSRSRCRLLNTGSPTRAAAWAGVLLKT